MGLTAEDTTEILVSFAAVGLAVLLIIGLVIALAVKAVRSR